MAPSAIQATAPSFDGFTTPKHMQLAATPVVFDPAKHLNYSPPASTISMDELHLPSTAISTVGSTQPFSLLSHEAVIEHRRELFSKPVLENCLHHTRPGSVQLRGMAPRYAPFIHQFWSSLEVLKIVSEIAGVEVVPVVDYEIAHTNVQLGPGGLDAARDTPIEPPEATREAISALQENRSEQGGGNGNPSIIEWHHDSHPFVCVVMLSDARYMTGGETVLKTGTGETLPVKAPQMGSAVILQGRYINHMALPAQNLPERITIVTSFRPKDPKLVDDSSLVNIRNKSQLSEIYYQWTRYRLRNLAKRINGLVDDLDAKYAWNIEKTDSDKKRGFCKADTVDVLDLEKWSKLQIDFLQKTLYEMRPLGQ
ncbi:MAG: hypothetical protein M1818_007986 [Claussenomyces sp. TS43310]|nr:MAG: hypothetical protein M1818_007986 [Claussenomyces sp. TS43310]